MKEDWKSATRDAYWPTNDPVQPEMKAVLARVRSNSLTDLGVQLLHANRAAQARSSARKGMGPVDMPDATPSRAFGLPSASAQEWLKQGSALSQTGSDSDTPEGHGGHRWTARRGLNRRTLALARSYMEDNLGENCTLDDLGKAVGLSPFHFSRLFRVSTGQSPMAYWRRLRIERSKQMLLHGDRKTSEIAATLGFSDQSHFSRTFRRMTGVPPGEYVRLRDVAEIAV